MKLVRIKQEQTPAKVAQKTKDQKRWCETENIRQYNPLFRERDNGNKMVLIAMQIRLLAISPQTG